MPLDDQLLTWSFLLLLLHSLFSNQILTEFEFLGMLFLDSLCYVFSFEVLPFTIISFTIWLMVGMGCGGRRGALLGMGPTRLVLGSWSGRGGGGLGGSSGEWNRRHIPWLQWRGREREREMHGGASWSWSSTGVIEPSLICWGLIKLVCFSSDDWGGYALHLAFG